MESELKSSRGNSEQKQSDDALRELTGLAIEPEPPRGGTLDGINIGQ